MVIETKYAFNKSSTKLIEKIIDDSYLQMNHISLEKGQNIPEHFTDSNVYLIIMQGEMKLKLDAQPPHNYTEGTIVTIPYSIKMRIQNDKQQMLEFFVVKSPNPREFEN